MHVHTPASTRVAAYATTATAAPAGVPHHSNSSTTASTSGVCSPRTAIETWFRPSPDSTRCPMPSGMVSAKSTRQARTTGGPEPGSSPEPSRVGHRSRAVIATATPTRTVAEPIRTRTAVTRTRRTCSSRAGSSEDATAFMTAADMPRSEKGISAAMPTSRPYWANAAKP